MSNGQYIDRAITREIPLIGGRSTVVDVEDYKYLKLFRWKLIANGSKAYAYANIPAIGKDRAMHRIIMDAPPGILVDHKDGDGLNNRKKNLRLCTHAQNMMNRKGTGKTSKYKGVSWDKQDKKWLAAIKKDGQKIVLGRFDEEDEAAIAYNEAAKDLHGEFGWLNTLPGFVTLPDSTTRSPGGRKPRPNYYPSRKAWCVKIKGKVYQLAKGAENGQAAAMEFDKLIGALGLIGHWG